MATPNALPPIPIRTPMVDQNGMISPAWLALVREIYNRVGGSVSSSNATLATQATMIDGRVTALESEVQGIGIGRAL